MTSHVTLKFWFTNSFTRVANENIWVMLISYFSKMPWGNSSWVNITSRHLRARHSYTCEGCMMDFLRLWYKMCLSSGAASLRGCIYRLHHSWTARHLQRGTFKCKCCVSGSVHLLKPSSFVGKKKKKSVLSRLLGDRNHALQRKGSSRHSWWCSVNPPWTRLSHFDLAFAVYNSYKSPGHIYRVKVIARTHFNSMAIVKWFGNGV